MSRQPDAEQEKTPSETPVMKHWGIWSDDGDGTGGWIVFMNNDVFWTTSRAVAEAQLARFRLGRSSGKDGLEVREF